MAKTSTPDKATDAPSFEDALRELEAIIDSME